MELKNGKMEQKEVIIIPTDMNEIPENKYKDNAHVKILGIHASVNEIGRSAFENCRK